MDLHNFEFALFIKDKSAPVEELRKRTTLYQDEKCDLYILMRRKVKSTCSADWRLLVQTIHIRSEDTAKDITIKRFNKPLLSKDVLLSAVFGDVIDIETMKTLPPWLSTSLQNGLFDCFYKCPLHIKLPETSLEYQSLLEEKEISGFTLQAIIKSCPNHLSTYQITNQIRSLPQFPPFSYIDNAFAKKLTALSLLPDNSNSSDHISLVVPINIQNHLGLNVTGLNGEIQLEIENRSNQPIHIQSFTSYITDVDFIEPGQSSTDDAAIIFSYDLPKHDPTILNEIHMNSDHLNLPLVLNENDKHLIHTHVEYTQNHASSSSQDITENYECDVYIHINIEWIESEIVYPIQRDYDLRVRLHPKPQLEIRYLEISALKLNQLNKIKVEVINHSNHTHKNVKYPFYINVFSFLIRRIHFKSSSSVLCNYSNEYINESLPHSHYIFSMNIVPQIPGIIVLPNVVCTDDNGKIIPSLCNQHHSHVLPI